MTRCEIPVFHSALQVAGGRPVVWGQSPYEPPAGRGSSSPAPGSCAGDISMTVVTAASVQTCRPGVDSVLLRERDSLVTVVVFKVRLDVALLLPGLELRVENSEETRLIGWRRRRPLISRTSAGRT